MVLSSLLFWSCWPVNASDVGVCITQTDRKLHVVCNNWLAGHGGTSSCRRRPVVSEQCQRLKQSALVPDPSAQCTHPSTARCYRQPLADITISCSEVKRPTSRIDFIQYLDLLTVSLHAFVIDVLTVASWAVPQGLRSCRQTFFMYICSVVLWSIEFVILSALPMVYYARIMWDVVYYYLQCFDNVGWESGGASGL